MSEIIFQSAEVLISRGRKLTTAESCTGGLIAKLCTDLVGSSAWFERGFVTYSNESKVEMLGVSAATIKNHGAVSEAVVAEMAHGAIKNSNADYSLVVSGIAGPDGGSEDKPVGTVWFGFATQNQDLLTEKKLFTGDRKKIRKQAAKFALDKITEFINSKPVVHLGHHNF